MKNIKIIAPDRWSVDCLIYSVRDSLHADSQAARWQNTLDRADPSKHSGKELELISNRIESLIALRDYMKVNQGYIEAVLDEADKYCHTVTGHYMDRVVYEVYGASVDHYVDVGRYIVDHIRKIRPVNAATTPEQSSQSDHAVFTVSESDVESGEPFRNRSGGWEAGGRVWPRVVTIEWLQESIRKQLEAVAATEAIIRAIRSEQSTGSLVKEKAIELAPILFPGFAGFDHLQEEDKQVTLRMARHIVGGASADSQEAREDEYR